MRIDFGAFKRGVDEFRKMISTRRLKELRHSVQAGRESGRAYCPAGFFRPWVAPWTSATTPAAEQLVLVRQAESFRKLACGVEGGDAMGEGPDLDRDEPHIHVLEALREGLRQGMDQEVEGMAGGGVFLSLVLAPLAPGAAGFTLGRLGGEHGGIEAGFLLGEGKIGLAHAREPLEGRPLALQGMAEPLGELREAAEGHLGHERVPAPEMAVEGSGRHAHELGRIGQGEAAKAPLGDEALRSLDQRLLQIPVMIALPVERAAPMPHDGSLFVAPVRLGFCAGRDQRGTSKGQRHSPPRVQECFRP